jgi:stearoyl-CoA desaturase (delta-9 desaturase)
MWGSKRFLTDDTSKNSLWVALLTWGEGWHNNHHAHPQSARHGLTWYEIDFNWYGIKALEMVGLVWDVKLPRLESLEKKKIPRDIHIPVEQLAPFASGDD